MKDKIILLDKRWLESERQKEMVMARMERLFILLLEFCLGIGILVLIMMLVSLVGQFGFLMGWWEWI